MIRVFTGPSPLAQLVRDELVARGVGAHIPDEALPGLRFSEEGMPPGWQAVVVPDEAAETHRRALEEVLALVSEVAAGEPTREDADDL